MFALCLLDFTEWEEDQTTKPSPTDSPIHQNLHPRCLLVVSESYEMWQVCAIALPPAVALTPLTSQGMATS
ncbi:hypothetical protein Pmani_004132 [Petrolisthes manimaculis]|uniref:Uncharacterized protein n=1 Tax=Petrolisthes manimaculis TaxID=1843537 RepID=A0AAE1QF92_9EUCA|nr:hypothetical protein Pmani_004132 [Petrolisthes manimaculis]